MKADRKSNKAVLKWFPKAVKDLVNTELEP